MPTRAPELYCGAHPPTPQPLRSIRGEWEAVPSALRDALLSAIHAAVRMRVRASRPDESYVSEVERCLTRVHRQFSS